MKCFFPSAIYNIYVMKKTKQLNKRKEYYYIITTMDGIPCCGDDGSIMQFHSTRSMRLNAKHRTFQTKKRHHTW